MLPPDQGREGQLVSGGEATLAAEEWRDWSEVAAADLADPSFRVLVDEINTDQAAWEAETAL